jgi:hypothetical protein
MQNVGCLAIDNKGSGKQVMVLGMFYDDKGRAQLWKWGQVQWWGRGGLGVRRLRWTKLVKGYLTSCPQFTSNPRSKAFTKVFDNCVFIIKDRNKSKIKSLLKQKKEEGI